MGVYEPLTRYLMSLPKDSWTTSFSEIERIIRRSLPRSAYEYRPWWGNQKSGNHSQSKAWRDAGWETSDVDLRRHTIRFERRDVRQGLSVLDEPIASDLWQRASELTGITEHKALIEAALTALIRQETARYFAQIGGTMPDASAAPRERPFE